MSDLKAYASSASNIREKIPLWSPSETIAELVLFDMAFRHNGVIPKREFDKLGKRKEQIERIALELCLDGTYTDCGDRIRVFEPDTVFLSSLTPSDYVPEDRFIGFPGFFQCPHCLTNYELKGRNKTVVWCCFCRERVDGGVLSSE